MKDLQSVLKLVIVAIVAGFALAAVLTGRAVVREHYAYETMVAPRTLHQMVAEMEIEEGSGGRRTTLLLGAGLASMAGLVFGGFILSMRGGSELLRQRRLGRKRANRRATPRYAPSAPLAEMLPEKSDGNENHTNRN